MKCVQGCTYPLRARNRSKYGRRGGCTLRCWYTQSTPKPRFVYCTRRVHVLKRVHTSYSTRLVHETGLWWIYPEGCTPPSFHIWNGSWLGGVTCTLVHIHRRPLCSQHRSWTRDVLRTRVSERGRQAGSGFYPKGVMYWSVVFRSCPSSNKTVMLAGSAVPRSLRTSGPMLTIVTTCPTCVRLLVYTTRSPRHTWGALCGGHRIPRVRFSHASMVALVIDICACRSFSSTYSWIMNASGNCFQQRRCPRHHRFVCSLLDQRTRPSSIFPLLGRQTRAARPLRSDWVEVATALNEGRP